MVADMPCGCWDCNPRREGFSTPGRSKVDEITWLLGWHKTSGDVSCGLREGLGWALVCSSGLVGEGHRAQENLTVTPLNPEDAPESNWISPSIALYHFMNSLVYKMFINICGLRCTGLFLRFKLINGWPFLPKRAMRYIIPLVDDGLGTA